MSNKHLIVYIARCYTHIENNNKPFWPSNTHTQNKNTYNWNFWKSWGFGEINLSETNYFVIVCKCNLSPQNDRHGNEKAIWKRILLFFWVVTSVICYRLTVTANFEKSRDEQIIAGSCTNPDRTQRDVNFTILFHNYLDAISFRTHFFWNLIKSIWKSTASETSIWTCDNLAISVRAYMFRSYNKIPFESEWLWNLIVWSCLICLISLRSP